MTEFELEAAACRHGNDPNQRRPFAGVTACMDFCAHSHLDLQNMFNDVTWVSTLLYHISRVKCLDYYRRIRSTLFVQVVTLTENPEEPDFEEQLHVSPLYRIDDSDEHGDHVS